MSQPSDRVPVPGSERAPLAGARAIGPTNPDESIDITIRLRPRPSSPSLSSLATPSGRRPGERTYLSRAELANAQGADSADIEKVEAFAHEHGLTVVEVSPPRRTVRLEGTASQLGTAFGVDLQEYDSPQGRYRGRVGSVHVPADLQGIVEAVLGLDNRPQARPSLRRAPEAAIAPRAAGTSFTPPQLASLYNFPKGATGQGECIAIIELGGGYRPADLKAYFAQLGIPVPSVTAVSVDRARNHPTNANSADGEVMLDIEVAGAVAPQARIVVYFAPNTDAGFLDAITTAVHDTVHNPSIISISWGGPESSWTQQAMTSLDSACQAAAAVGVTIYVAAGDSGSSDGVTDGKAHVDFPASSPNVVACGGTHLTASGNTISAEVVWNDGANGGATGGGISDVFPVPAYQANAKVPPSLNPGGRVGRGVPDVAGDASPATGYVVRVDGQQLVFGGTSAVAPLWAGLTALLNQQLGKPVGALNPLIYAMSTAETQDITVGNNDESGTLGGYKAGAGWDPCSGWGSPNGTALLNALKG